MTDVESRLIQKAIRDILPDFALGMAQRDSLEMTRLVSDGSVIAESESNEAVALVSFEVSHGTHQGLVQLCVPWKQVAQNSRPLSPDAGKLREIMKSGAIKVPVIATARISRLKLSARELSGLNPGDVILTDVSPKDEIRLEVDGREIFCGTPGQSHDRKVILLTTATTTKLTAVSAESAVEIGEKRLH